MQKMEEAYLDYKKNNNLRNKLINQIKLYADNLTNVTFGSTLDCTVFEILEFLNISNPRIGQSRYFTPRYFSNPNITSLNKESVEVEEKLPVIENEKNMYPADKLSFFENPSAISLLRISKSSSAIGKEETEDGDEGFNTPNSISKLSAKLSKSGLKALKEVQSYVKSRSLMDIGNPFADQFISDLKSNYGLSSSSNKDQIDESVLRSDQLAAEPLPQHFDDKFSPSGKENKSKRRKVATLWGMTKINVYDDHSRTYEIFGTSTQQPNNIVCGKVEGIFVIGPQDGQ